jgi:hypothetical protein
LHKKPCKCCSFCLTEIASLNYWQEKADAFAADAPRGGGQRQKPAENKRPNRNAGGQSRQSGGQQSATPEGDLQAKLAALKGKFK